MKGDGDSKKIFGEGNRGKRGKMERSFSNVHKNEEEGRGEGKGVGGSTARAPAMGKGKH